MESCPERAAALALLRKYNTEPFHLQHALTVESVMGWYARDLGYGEEADFWSAVGLLHDVDFEKWPEEHCKKAPELLAEIGCSDMEVSSLKKKFKDKKFAAGCSRDVIKDGAARLGWELETLMDKTLQAMRESEARVAEETASLS